MHRAVERTCDDVRRCGPGRCGCKWVRGVPSERDALVGGEQGNLDSAVQP
jgi:hypothetical protein